MVTVNTAFAVLRVPERRAEYDKLLAAPPPVKSAVRPTSPTIVPPPPRADSRGKSGTVLSHGRYAGWTLDQLVRQDPDYLQWLRRHTSGIRYRVEMGRLLDGAASASQASLSYDPWRGGVAEWTMHRS